MTQTVVTTRGPAYQAYQILYIGFIVAPLLAGLDKFTHLLTDWDRYLAPVVANALPVSSHTFMLFVGIVEIAAAVLVAVRPRIGAYVVAAWLCGIIANLLLIPGLLRCCPARLRACAGSACSRQAQPGVRGRPFMKRHKTLNYGTVNAHRTNSNDSLVTHDRQLP